MDYITVAIYISMISATLITLAIVSSLKNSIYISLRNLLFPKTEINNVKEEAGFIILHPLFWIISFGVSVLFLTSFILQLKNLEVIFEWVFFSCAIIFSLSIFYPMVLWYMNRKYVESLKYVMGGISFGALAAITAYFINTISIIIMQSISGFETGIFLVFIIAPIFEEVIKITGVYILAERKYFNDIFDGAIAGFSIGCGFALLENIFYIITKIPSFSLEILIFRTFYSTLAHASFSTFGGIIIGKGKQDTGQNKFVVYIMAIIVALMAHMAFNILAMIDVINVELMGAEFYMFSPIIVIVMIIFIIATIWNKKGKQ